MRPFLPLLCEVIRFGASPDGQRVLAALRDLPRLRGGGRNKMGRDEIDEQLLIGSWRRLVLNTPEVEPGTVDWRAYKVAPRRRPRVWCSGDPDRMDQLVVDDAAQIDEEELAAYFKHWDDE